MAGKNSIKEKMNEWGSAGTPFIFIIDFEIEKPLISRLDDVDPEKLLFNINGITNCNASTDITQEISLVKHPESYDRYLCKFNTVKAGIQLGNSYLLNLTCSTPVEISVPLKDIFYQSRARYRIWYEDEFVCFSPETFVTIKDGVIRSFPMKGTIDAAVKDAAQVILNDPKETAEHYTIVDLIRNDLNIVSKNVKVERFRYIDRIDTREHSLLQVSSEISGTLDEGYQSRLGDIIYSLLPAGSVSGAPKKKTTEMISETEQHKRGYYTGIAGIFDGQNLDSGVMIRFIEKTEKSLIYRSGGGITSFSEPEKEYLEMIKKIYVPVT